MTSKGLRKIAVLVVMIAFAGVSSSLMFLGGGYTTTAEASNACAPAPVSASGRLLVKGDPITNEQLRLSKIIIGVGKKRGDSRRDVKIALMVAIQESSIRNLRYGDRDSLGIFQQRPSQGWGTKEQILNPVYSSNAFYVVLETVEDRYKLSLLDVALEVQRPSRSAYESPSNRFTDWEATADALIGGTRFIPTTGSTEGCNFGNITGGLTDPGPGPQSSKTGLVPRAENIQAIIERNWGCDVNKATPCVREIAGYSNRTSGPQDHTLGLALDVTVGKLGGYPGQTDTAFGWQIACQLASNANKIGLQYIIWQGTIWNVERAQEGTRRCSGGGLGWRPYCSGYYGGCGKVLGPTAGHFDHIHITVQPGVGG